MKCGVDLNRFRCGVNFAPLIPFISGGPQVRMLRVVAKTRSHCIQAELRSGSPTDSWNYPYICIFVTFRYTTIVIWQKVNCMACVSPSYLILSGPTARCLHFDKVAWGFPTPERLVCTVYVGDQVIDDTQSAPRDLHRLNGWYSSMSYRRLTI